MAHVFLQYDQATMIHKYSLDYNSDWLYITFINRTYRINRKTGSVQWSDNDFEIIHEANHNEAMTIYDVLCYSKDRCHLSHEFVNINSLSSVRTGNLSPNRGFFQNTADFFNGKTVELRNACIALSGKELEKGEVVRSLGRSYIPGCELCVQRRAKGKVLIYSNISLSAKCYYKLYSLFK